MNETVEFETDITIERHFRVYGVTSPLDAMNADGVPQRWSALKPGSKFLAFESEAMPEHHHFFVVVRYREYA